MTSLSTRADPPGGPRPLRDSLGRIAGGLRPWPHRPDVAHLVLHELPRPGLDVATIERWSALAQEDHYAEIRTSALSPRQQVLMGAAGFEVLQRLVLLQRPLPLDHPADQHDAGAATWPGALRTLRPIPRLSLPRRIPASGEGTLAEIAAVDDEAFGASWCLDPAAIVDACRATPRSRVRGVRREGRLVAFAVSGRAGRDGYLQRLAVDPGHQRRGLGRMLVVDALRWCTRQGARRMLVNTHVDNGAALALYQHLGFTPRSDGLVVMRRRLDPTSTPSPVASPAGDPR
jgi:GNAT superfamily N-acetyltransferase